MYPILLAVHLSDSVLSWPWLAGGFLAATALLWWSAAGVDETEIARISLLTAVFFVASLIHVRVGPTSVHLLLNGLLGLVLGRRAPLAVGVGMLLQYLLLQHGGYTTLGINTVIVSIPALLARPIRRIALAELRQRRHLFRDGFLALAYLLHPQLFLILFFILYVVIHFPWNGGADPDFRSGFIVGFVCVGLTALGNACVLVVAGVEDWRLIAAFVLAAHVPIAFIEGVVAGAACRFLRGVRPDLLMQSI